MLVNCSAILISPSVSCVNNIYQCFQILIFCLLQKQQIPVFFHNTTILIVSYCKGRQGEGQKVSEVLKKLKNLSSIFSFYTMISKNSIVPFLKDCLIKFLTRPFFLDTNESLLYVNILFLPFPISRTIRNLPKRL